MAQLTLNKLASQTEEKETDQVQEQVQDNGSVQEQALSKGVSTQSPMSLRYKRFVNKLETDEAFMNDLNVITDANDLSKRGSFIVMLDLKRALGEELCGDLPKPDSEGGNNPDKYGIEDTKRKGSFYNDLFDNLTGSGKVLAGKEIAFQLSQIALVKGKPEDFARAEEAFKTMNADLRDKLEGKLKQRRNYGRGVIRQAAAIILKIEELKELDKIAVRYPDDSSAPEADTPRPFVVYEKENQMQFKAMTAPELLAINVEKATAKGGTMKAVLESMKVKRTPGGSTDQNGGDEGEDEGTPLTFDTLPDTFEELADFLVAMEEDKRMLGRFYAKLNNPKEEALLISVFRIANMLDNIVSKPELLKRYNAIEAEYSANGRGERKAS